LYPYYLFFFSSRRRHTRFSRDWSSDVCSSDLTVALGWKKQGDPCCSYEYYPTKADEKPLQIDDDVSILIGHNLKFDLLHGWQDRSEERRVGKECRGGESQGQ